MGRVALILLLVVCPVLAAHPLDDQADMTAELHVLEDGHLEVLLAFDYPEGIPSYTEFRNGLDANLDGIVTEQEVRRRFVELADEMLQSLTLTRGGARLELEADVDRFVYRDLNNPDGDLDNGLPTHSARIHYTLVFSWRGEAPPPGEHKLMLWFVAPQTLVHTPAEQLHVFDHRPSERRLLPVDYTLRHEVFPAMSTVWVVEAPPAQTIARSEPAPPASKALLRESSLPSWLTLGLGAMLLAAGLGLGVARAGLRRGSWLTVGAALTAGAAVVAGSLLSSGAFDIGI
jgi:hypothetical protein